MTLAADATRTTMIDKVSSVHHLAAERSEAGWRGERFEPQQAGQALSRMPVTRAA